MSVATWSVLHKVKFDIIISRSHTDVNLYHRSINILVSNFCIPKFNGSISLESLSNINRWTDVF